MQNEISSKGNPIYLHTINDLKNWGDEKQKKIANN